MLLRLPKFHPLTDHEALDLAALPHGKKLHTHCLENVCAPGTVWTGPENLVPTLGFQPQTIQPVASHYNLIMKANRGSGVIAPF